MAVDAAEVLPPAQGVEWRNASVDAEDAYYARVWARVFPGRVVLYDRRSMDVVADYEMADGPMVNAVKGFAVGLPAGHRVPLIVRAEAPCNCDKPTVRTAKGAG